jgi:hypothetical protein
MPSRITLLGLVLRAAAMAALGAMADLKPVNFPVMFAVYRDQGRLSGSCHIAATTIGRLRC